MSRPWGLIYTLTALVVFLALSLIFVLRLNTAREANRAESELSYEQLAAELNQLDDLVSLGRRLDRYFATVATVESLALFFPDQGMVYLRARDPGILRLDSADIAEFSGFPSYRLRELSTILQRASLESSVFENLYLDAAYSVLSYRNIYPPLRDTLIALLGFAFLLVVLALLTSRTREAATPSADREQKQPANHDRAPVVESPAPLIVPETHESAATDDQYPVVEDIEVEEVTAENEEPGTLFDPATGLSFEAHMERKLGLELERAAYNDQDLSCMMISFPGDSSPEARSRWARHVLDAFQFEDLCFGVGQSTFCVVLPNTELPQAIRQATEFQLTYNPEAIGISARNGRLVEASRVLKEARRSLEHARTQPSRVVGFRPDPKKYRQFVSDNPS